MVLRLGNLLEKKGPIREREGGDEARQWSEMLWVGRIQQVGSQRAPCRAWMNRDGMGISTSMITKNGLRGERLELCA